MDPSVLPPDLVTCRELGYLILSGGSGEKGGKKQGLWTPLSSP